VSGFAVDSRSLLAVRDALGRLHNELVTMHTAIFGCWGALGGRALEGELEHFCGTWHWAVGEISDEIAGLMHGLTLAAAAYERIEHRVATAGSGSGTTVIGGSPGGGGSGSGSGTTVIGGSPGGGGSGSGSGTTVIGGPPAGGGSGSGSGSGTTVIP